MAAEPEVIEVTTDRVACDGGGGALGHPLVYLTIGETGDVVCGYCGRRYVRTFAPASAATGADAGAGADAQ
ncbi:MAG: zinc-finger domain-containing protein [Pseudomonadota bacterium]